MQIAKILLFTFLSTVFVNCAHGDTFERIRYKGGMIAAAVDPNDWNNRLSVTSGFILFTLRDGRQIEIRPSAVTALSYGQEAQRRVGSMAAVHIPVAPLPRFGPFHRKRGHFIGMQYTTAEGSSSGLLLQADKHNYQAILIALGKVTQFPVFVDEKERQSIPPGVATTLAKKSGAESDAEQAAAAFVWPVPDTGTIKVLSNPDGADLYVDDKFMGNCPVLLKLQPGTHPVRVKRIGYKDWSRQIDLQAGSRFRLWATLER
ncbi:MAG: PEGA domain-containing protein [Acidobacteriia bacterium]|nr:PEGA domain-containing protein [Terriglobia bacterium]